MVDLGCGMPTDFEISWGVYVEALILVWWNQVSLPKVPQVRFGYALVGQHVPRHRVTARERRLLAAQPVTCGACQWASPLDRIANCFRSWVAYWDSNLHGNT